MRIDVISMGCSKNLVDSERLMKRIEAKGHYVVHDPEEPSGDYVVVNTCGFIGDAKEESINLLLQLADAKGEGRIGKIVVMGCLSERYREELRESIPEVDVWFGKFDWNGFIDMLPDMHESASRPREWERKLTTSPWNAYLKISEGCNRFCAFCAIPLITGRHKSRTEEEILDEVRDLVKKGVKEFNVIAQDLSSYGLDIYGEYRLPSLIEKMAQIEGVDWIRLHYAYPSDFPYDILRVMRENNNVASYLDIALQHISDNVLRAMRRHISKEETIDLIKRIRREVPDIKLRTTLMVGFPGETDEDFNELYDFTREMRFERMGAFAYSEEEGTYAQLHLGDDVPEEVKQERLDRLMDLQRSISADLNEEMIGKTVKVIVDRIEDNIRVGRSQWDSPEVDQEIYVSDSSAKEGDFIYVEITEADEYDLYGKEVKVK